MRQLSEQEINQIVSMLRAGRPLPENYKTILFETKKEYELVYADKEREEDILADTLAVPLQKVKTFRNGQDTGDWTNMLIFGDNLQVLKTLLQMKQEGKLKNSDGTLGVRLVYIDPPFATKQDFQGAKDEQAYQDKIFGARFLEFLRKRLVFIRELLSTDGFIVIHLDYRYVSHFRILFDEIFGRVNFRNEIITRRSTKSVQSQFDKISSLAVANYTLLLYSKNINTRVRKLTSNLPISARGKWDTYWRSPDRQKMRYEIFEITPERGQWRWKKERGYKAKANYEKYLQGGGSEDDDTDELDEYYISNIENTGQKLDFVRLGPNGTVQYYVPPRVTKMSNNVWMDITSSSRLTGYPTEKSEQLLDRIILWLSKQGDIVLDAFVGSGTTLAVAEKLKRNWIGIDCGKLAIYSTQKRLLNLKDKIGNQGNHITPNPFTLYNAGLYDYKMIRQLPWEKYRDFALKLFQCRDERHEISKIELDGYLGADSVLVFDYKKFPDAIMDRGFIDDLHQYMGSRIGRRFFIIARAASVQFLEDYIEKGQTRYFVLRIPYSIIEEIHQRGFSKMIQPMSEMEVNETVDAVGFDFIQVPTVECRYLIDNKKGQLELGKGTIEYIIKIETFESKVISRKPVEFANLETLSMVMLDYDFDGEVFDLDTVFYAEDLKKNDYMLRFGENKLKGRIMVIYIDIFGNEKREVKTAADFSRHGGN